MLLIMTETYIECGHTKTTIHACGVKLSYKIITFSHLNSNFNYNFRNNSMQQKVESTFVALILLFASLVFFHHLYLLKRSQVVF